MTEHIHLNRMLEQIDSRLTLERVAGRLPVVQEIIDENRRYNAILHRLAICLQKYEIFLNEEEIRAMGEDPERAAAELTDAVQAVNYLATRYQ